MKTSAKILVYTTTNCPFCVSAKRLLDSRQLAYEEIDVSDPVEKAALKERTGWRTVPQIFIQGQMIGGYQELAALDQEGKLQDLLKE